MVSQSLPHALVLEHDRDCVRLQQRMRANADHFQQLWGFHGSRLPRDLPVQRMISLRCELYVVSAHVAFRGLDLDFVYILVDEHGEIWSI
jgi:hypothetical protein